MHRKCVDTRLLHYDKMGNGHFAGAWCADTLHYASKYLYTKVYIYGV